MEKMVALASAVSRWIPLPPPRGGPSTPNQNSRSLWQEGCGWAWEALSSEGVAGTSINDRGSRKKRHSPRGALIDSVPAFSGAGADDSHLAAKTMRLFGACL